LAEIARRELAPSDGGVPTASHTFAGRLADGTIVLTETSGGLSEVRATGLRFLRPDGEDAAIESPWPTLPPEAQGVQVSPDGTTLAYTIDNTAYLLRAGQEPVEWGTDMRAVWFVTTPAMPIGTPCPEPEPDGFGLIDGVPFADLDGDGLSERVMLRTDGPLHWVRACGTASAFADAEIYAAAAGSRTVVPVDIEGDGQAELWITNATFHGTSPDVPCVALYRAAGDTLEPTTENRCIGDVGFACVAVDGVVRPVFYERAGDTLTAILDDGTVLGERTYQPGELDEMYSLFDLAC
jgi:hypothetical protein